MVIKSQTLMARLVSTLGFVLYPFAFVLLLIANDRSRVTRWCKTNSGNSKRSLILTDCHATKVPDRLHGKTFVSSSIAGRHGFVITVHIKHFGMYIPEI